MASVMGTVLTDRVSELGGRRRDSRLLSLYAVKGYIVLFGECEYVVLN